MYGKFNGQNDGQTVSYGFLEFAPCPFGGRWSWLAWDQLDSAGLLGLSSDIMAISQGNSLVKQFPGPVRIGSLGS